MATKKQQVHGSGGVFYGGDWLPIEECADTFNIKNGSDKCGGDCSVCPRSRTRHSAVKPDGLYDVVIIGAGCIGSAVARELSKTTLSVLMLEAADDVTQGATKGNSGIVHAGYDDKPGSVKAKFCWPGNQMFPQLDRELHFGYSKNGSLVVASSPENEELLQELMARGDANGVKNLRIVGQQELREMEPHIAESATSALFSPDAGTLIPYEYAIALAENAADNGVEVRVRREVTAIDKTDTGFTIHARHWEPRPYAQALAKAQAGGGGGGGGAGARALAAAVGTLPLLAVAAAALLAPEQLAQVPVTLPQLLGAVALCSTAAALMLLGGVGRGGAAAAAAAPPALSSDTIGKGGERVSVPQMHLGGTGSCAATDGVTVEEEEVRCRFIVNCAGTGSDRVAAMVGDTSFKIKPRLGEYLLLHRDQGHLATRTLFPCPGPMGKGVLAQKTLWGNLILGPTARDVHDPATAATPLDTVLRFILSKCRTLLPGFDPSRTIHTFSGARAKSDRGDWIIEASEASPRFILACGIDSPGLAGSPAIALEVVRLLGVAGLAMEADPGFNPNRAPIIVPKQGWRGLKAGPVGKVVGDPGRNVVCKCEKVTEAEVVAAMHRSLPVDSTQAIRKRTRAGMGHCQADPGNYNCECRVADIIARETDAAVADAVAARGGDTAAAAAAGYVAGVASGRRPWPGTSMLTQRWLEEPQKTHLMELSYDNDETKA